MLKETGYQEKITILEQWLPEILEVVKKDLKNEHLKVDKDFCKRYFLGKNPQQVSIEEMLPAYVKDIEKGNTGLGEFIATRWLLKNTDIYGYFEERLKVFNVDFEAIEELSSQDSHHLIQAALEKFDAKRLYIFSVFNSVVFSADAYEMLKNLAITQTETKRKEFEEQELVKSIEQLQKRHARELSATTDRFEKKLNGLQKKYLHDVEGLKKQVSQLQKKLSEVKS